MPKYAVFFAIPERDSYGSTVVETDAPFAEEHLTLLPEVIRQGLADKKIVERATHTFYYLPEAKDIVVVNVLLLMKYGGDKPTVTVVEY